MKRFSEDKLRIFSIALLTLSLGFMAYSVYSAYFGSDDRTYATQPLSENLKTITPPSLPDISKYTVDAIISRIPDSTAGTVKVLPPSASMSFFNMALPREEVKRTMETKQQVGEPVVIEIQSGVYTLDDLTLAVNNPNYLEKTDSGHTLKIPLFIADKGGLIVRGNSNKKQIFRLAEEGGAFISVFGKFYAVDSDIAGWQITRNQPSTFVNKESFRPFLLFWSHSETYIGRSILRNLGYSSPKMYGLSYSSDVNTRGDTLAIRTTAWLLDTVIEDLYYGLYSYEVNDIAILRNELKNNIIYGIDPHDRSSRLIIGYNNSYGTKKRHGIIVSREVNDSWIFNNHSHENNGSGIMLDRNSVRNVIANNLVDNNGSDGIVFIESPNNISYMNEVRDNKKSGIRIRNSWDIKLLQDKITGNAGYAVLAYATPLAQSGDPERIRDEKLDPYGVRTSFDVISAALNNNTSGSFNLMNVERASFYDLTVFKSSGGYFEGDPFIKGIQQELFQESFKGKEGAEIYQLNYTPQYSPSWGKHLKSEE